MCVWVIVIVHHSKKAWQHTHVVTKAFWMNEETKFNLPPIWHERKFSSQLQSNSRLLGCERVMETRAEFHFSWVYTFSVTLSSLRNWANNDRYRLRPSTPAQLCWSSSRLQPLQNYNLVKFAQIRPSTLNHDRNLWNFRGAPDETTCFAVFFRCPRALLLFLHEIV